MMVCDGHFFFSGMLRGTLLIPTFPRCGWRRGCLYHGYFLACRGHGAGKYFLSCETRNGINGPFCCRLPNSMSPSRTSGKWRSLTLITSSPTQTT